MKEKYDIKLLREGSQWVVILKCKEYPHGIAAQGPTICEAFEAFAVVLGAQMHIDKKAGRKTLF